MELAIIGGGAAGCFAAITAADLGVKVSVYEAGNMPGRKILTTGNGRCNYTTLALTPLAYNLGDEMMNAIPALEAFGLHDTLEAWKRLGIYPRLQDVYFYPASGQASSVQMALVRGMEERGVKVHNNSKASSVVKKESGEFEVTLESGYKFTCDAVIMACGGCAAPATGSDGSGIAIAQKMGHDCLKPIPALTYMTTDAEDLAALHGVRVKCNASLLQGDNFMGEQDGEVQFTRDSISGIPTFQMSWIVGRFLENGPMTLRLNLILNDPMGTQKIEEDWNGENLPHILKIQPYADEDAYISDLTERDCQWFFRYAAQNLEHTPGMTLQTLLCGVIPDKLASIVMKRAGLDARMPIGNMKGGFYYKEVRNAAIDAFSSSSQEVRGGGHAGTTSWIVPAEDWEKLFRTLTCFDFNITGTGDFEHAQVTSGGITFNQVSSATLESDLYPGLFFAGEMLDVDGPCGGYNLQWAWSSGTLAARSAAAYLKQS